jgi:hypothetical protein
MAYEVKIGTAWRRAEPSGDMFRVALRESGEGGLYRLISRTSMAKRISMGTAREVPEKPRDAA